jgi:phosphopantothenoylcysteine synthetase/decarboxylase
MQDRWSLLITSGGTREPIDEVRYIGNASTGALGCALAREALARGLDVVLLSGTGAQVPPDHERLVRETFSTASDLSSRLERWGGAPRKFRAVVHAAAVADFRPAPVAGKISSSRVELVLKLEPVPKIVDRVKEWFPGALLVKFKLEVGRSDAELLRVGEASRLESRADLIVVNDLRRMVGDRHPAMILDGRAPLAVEGKEAIARAVLDKLETLA